MRYSQSEKMEIIRIVENSSLSSKQTLEELNINRSTFVCLQKVLDKSGIKLREDFTSYILIYRLLCKP